jgi:septum formation protein
LPSSSAYAIIESKTKDVITAMLPIILASQSPRRRELLTQIGVTFSIQTASGDEITTQTEPSAVVTELAAQKASEVALSVQAPALIIGADTVVAQNGRIMGKPADEEDAFRMLTSLQGKTHTVYTGVCVICKEADKQTSFSFAEATQVTMYPMSEQQIHAYIATGEPMDKAGAYGIQGRCAAYIQGICGDYNNVVGLPVARLVQECRKNGIDLLA